MADKIDFETYVKSRKPIFAYNPQGIMNVDLIRSVIQSGGFGLINLERLPSQEVQQLLQRCYQQLPDSWGVRVTNAEQLEQVLTLHSDNFLLLVIIGDMALDEKTVEKIKTKKILLLAEVVSLNEAYQKKWAEGYIVKGNEAAGRVSDETSFILTQQFADAGLTFLVQGGVGLYTISGIFAVGAKGVVLDTQLYLTPESPLTPEVKSFLSKLDATDTKVLGKATAKQYRVYARLGTRIVKDYLQKEKELLALSLEERTKAFQEQLLSQREMFDAKDIANSLLPVGQDIPFAKILTEKFSTVEGILNGLLKQVVTQLESVAKEFPLAKDSPVTKELGVSYPIIQGPMANVSESPEFAKVLADEGALPFLALGSLFPNQTRTLIRETKALLGSKPYGCGIIGLEANKTARDKHLEILREEKPPFVVVAAGTIQQAKEVQSYGITTFLHTPSPAIFAEAIDAGVNYLVLEGMECGGHIGVLTSFVLWELALHRLKALEGKIKQQNKKVVVAFAGGIGDRFSAAQAAVLCGALPELMQGILWVGTAYLLTKEIVATGALQPLYQQLALNAKETMVLGETVNTRARSIPTPFAKEIIKRELERLKKGVSLKERKHQYERDNLGATRIAARGEIWNPDGEDDKPNRFMPIDEEGQYQKGNYLIGQIVASLRCVRSVVQLHQELTSYAKEIILQKTEKLLPRLEGHLTKTFTFRPFTAQKEQIEQSVQEEAVFGTTTTVGELEGIAIVGLGCIFPDAHNIKEYWNNILNKVYSIREIPAERWAGKIELFYDKDKNAPNKSYTKIAATIGDFQFNSLEFKIPPKVAQNMGRSQKLALIAAKEALTDAGLLRKGVDNSKTAVIVGNAMGDEIRISHTRKIFLPEVLSAIRSSPYFQQMDPKLWKQLEKAVLEKYEQDLPPINEDAMPGELSNIIAGRIANIFNLRGKNMTTDAACASSLAALNVAVKTLLDKECDAVLCGGADCSLDPTTFVKFSKIGALSAKGSFPFDARADGFVMGEGAGFVVLKRLSDAIRDGNKIYAVIRGLGGSSDGKGKGITAPNPLGQRLAIERALEQAGITLEQLQLIEAHGTSTKVGDVVELEVLQSLVKQGKPSSIAIGSVKSQIGHLKSAAGIAALIKATLALYHKVFPPSVNFETPNPKVKWENTPFFVPTEKQSWPQPATGTRLAGVSSFGFGGTNYHVILEEFVPGKTKGHLPTLITAGDLQKVLVEARATSHVGQLPVEKVLDTQSWITYYEQKKVLETEPLFIGANSESELQQAIEKFKASIPRSSFGQDGIGPRIRDLSYQSLSELQKKIRVGFSCTSFDELETKINLLLEGLANKQKRRLLRNKGLFYSVDHSLGKVAFLFPGQGSQYVGMGKELWEKYAIVRETFREADTITKELLGFPISDIIFAFGKSDAETKELLRQTEITQPAIFTLDIAIFRLLQSFGIQADFVAGHSLGEYAALVASGILSLRDGFLAVVPRGKAMAKFDTKDKGMMASIGAGYKEVEAVLKGINDYVIAANKNAPNQTVISGSTAGVKAAIKAFTEKGITAIPLAVSGAFHSKIVEPAIVDFREALKKLTFNKPKIPISSNVTGELYPKSREEIINLLCDQICSPVEWIKQIEKMYVDGVRTFIEIGPKWVLTTFTRTILEDKKDILALPSIHPKKGEIKHFAELLTALGVYGYPLTYPPLESEIYSREFKYPLEKFFVSRPQSLPVHPVEGAFTTRTPFDRLLSDPELAHLAAEKEFEDYLKLQAPAINAFLKAGYDTYKTTIAAALEEKRRAEKLQISTEAIGITGVSIGLPGKNRKVFSEDNFDAILAGENFIDPIPEEIREKMLDKNIVRLVKDAIKGAQFQVIDDVNEVIKLAAQKGEFDLAKEYGIKAEFVDILDVTFQLAFAAGIEALRDAGIPLAPLKVKTSVGKEITKGWALPESLRDETGIVFASAFPAYSNLISIVSEYLTDKFAHQELEHFQAVFDQLIAQIKDPTARERIQKFYEQNVSQLTDTKDSRFQFSRKFLFEVLSMGHSQFAQFIRARGPNTQVNAACSSTTQAISIGEDWIRTGRCKRVIVIAADDVTNEQMLEWIGSGFLAVGAATTKENVKEAALPFDKRRHGMIIGMGAVGLILESESAMKTRGVKPIVDLLGTHIVNSAFHGTRLDRDHISTQMNQFISTIEKRFDISRDEIARELVFVSHETYTPARGGSASAEVDALRKTFKNLTEKIVIANTKGFTGHAMGAGIEDVVAVKILQKGIVPPVANWKEQDPELGPLNLSKGGHYPVKYALRFAAGFGSQLTLALFRLNTPSNRFDPVKYDSWLRTLGGTRETLEVVNKTLLLKEDPSLTRREVPTPAAVKQPIAATNVDLVKSVIKLIAEKTGYPEDMIEPDMNLEEDLGIDTVKQAELFGLLREQYNLPREEGVRIQDYYSVNKIAEYLGGRISGTPSTSQRGEQLTHSAGAPTTTVPKQKILEEVLNLISEKTGYPVDMIEPDMELEEDLGIDTVKQAEIFGIIRNKWSLPREEGIRIQDYSTVNKIADYILSRLASQEAQQGVQTDATTTKTTAQARKHVPITRRVLKFIAAPKIKVAKAKLTNQQFMVVGDPSPFREETIRLLQEKKAKVVNVLEMKNLSRLSSLSLPDEVDGVVFIEPKTTKKTRHANIVKGLFSLLKAVQLKSAGKLLVVQPTPTAFGWSGKAAPLIGSLSGFAKAFARERNDCTVRIVSCKEPQQALNELIEGDGALEVSYTETGKRQVIITIEQPITKEGVPSLQITEDDLILITGGAQGITYEITKAIAEKYHPKIALVGRTKLLPNIDELVQLSPEELEEKKNQFIAKLKDQGIKITPVQIQREWSKTLKAIAVYKAQEELRNLGSEVNYYSTDISQAEAFKKTLQQIEVDFKTTITGVIHGAGIESSKFLKDKKPEDFERVYTVKTIGFDTILEEVNLQKIKFLVCFSSVAARFGNIGQVDYSAANDYLSKGCWQLQQQGIRAISICWSAWGELGMATRGSIMKILEQSGITPISTKEGVQAFLDELEYGQEVEVVYSGTLGKMLESPGPFIPVNPKAYPLVGAIKRNFDGSINAGRDFSLETDLYLDHHRFEEVPYLPGVMGLELFAQLTNIAFPKQKIKAFKDVEFSSAIKFKNNLKQTIYSRIETQVEEPIITIEAFRLKNGEPVGIPIKRFSTKLQLGKREKQASSKPKMSQMVLAKRKLLYNILPHGSRFQVLEAVTEKEENIIGKIVSTLEDKKQFSWEINKFFAHPLSIEAGFQAMGFYDLVVNRKMGLPYKIDFLEFFDTKGEPAFVVGQKIGGNDLGSKYHFTVLTKNGELVLRAQGYTTVKVDFGANLAPLSEIHLNRVKQLFSLPKNALIEVIAVDSLKNELQDDESLLEHYLHPTEVTKFYNYKVEKRRFEWLAGVVAIKKALQQLNPKFIPNKIVIEKDSLGKPYILQGKKTLPISISITHSNGFAAGIVNPENMTGIDLEVIEKRSGILVEELLSKQELELLKKQKAEITDTLLAKIWSAKEAASKVLGVGLNIDLHDIAITNLTDKEIAMQIAAEKLPEQARTRKTKAEIEGTLKLAAKTTANKDFVAAVCQLDPKK